jgi:hypothetical protein
MDYYLELADLYKNELTKTYFLIFRDTISTLINRGKSTSSKINPSSSGNDAKNSAHTSGTIYFHRALQAFWQGHVERCQHYLVKVLQFNSVTAKLSNIVAMFIHGLNSLQLLRTKSTAKLRLVPRTAIKVLKAASLHSEWNFQNKARHIFFDFLS